ncbi:MAG: aspartate kinase [Muribaculaceae bacterium]|nr:aspartate kinase [Muribaculaceae bacterium]
MKVKKFGGTSVGSAERIKNVARLIGGCTKDIVVLSAMSGTTNALLEISASMKVGDKRQAAALIDGLAEKYAGVIDELYSSDTSRKEASEITDSIFSDLRALNDKDFGARTEKEIVAKGEMISTNLMNIYLHEQGIGSALLDALEFMKTDSHGEPDQEYISQHAAGAIARHPDAALYITQGFICRNDKGEIDNLQRGGSDYTASLIGAAVGADEIEIWTDIDGMHNNDPRFVDDTRPVHNLHFEEAAELAYFGAKILHPTCILPAREKNIPVRLLNTLDPSAEGTLIENVLGGDPIKAVAAKDNITAIKIKSGRMLLAYGFLKKVFEIFEKYETAIDMIATSEVGVSLTIDNEKHLPEIERELRELGTVTIDRDMVIVCVVGDLEWTRRGFEAKALEALCNVPVRMISYGGSNYNISFLIRKEDKVKALRMLSYHLF